MRILFPRGILASTVLISPAMRLKTGMHLRFQAENHNCRPPATYPLPMQQNQHPLRNASRQAIILNPMAVSQERLSLRQRADGLAPAARASLSPREGNVPLTLRCTMIEEPVARSKPENHPLHHLPKRLQRNSPGAQASTENLPSGTQIFQSRKGRAKPTRVAVRLPYNA